MKSLLLSASCAALIALALPQPSTAEAVIRVGGHAAHYNQSHYRKGLPSQSFDRGQRQYGSYQRADYGRGYAYRAADCYPYPRQHYFYQWQRPYYGFRAHGGGFSYGYGIGY